MPTNATSANALSSNDCTQAIIETLARIPKGKTCAYGELAKLAGYPGKARYVGFVLKNLPDGSKLPWHRVVNAQGKSSFPPDSERYQLQHRKLFAEGVDLRVKPKRYFWQ